MTDRYVSVWITPTNPEEDIYKPLECSLIHPHSTWVVSMEMEKRQQPPRRDTQEFEVLMIAMGSKDAIRDLNSSFGNSNNELSMSRDFWKRIEELGGEVHVTMLTTVICDPGSREAGKNKIISRGRLGGIFSMDVHPTQAWILTGHEGGFVSIWTYQTQKRVMELQVAKQATYPVYSVKFIAKEKWFATGVGHGHVRVYDYTSTTKDIMIKKIKAHGGKPVTSLAVHPTYPYLLTSSQDDNSIKLWDWGHGWSCARTFDGHTGGVGSLTFSRWDINSFASVGYDGGEAKIWDLQRQEFIHKLGGHGFTVCDVASHPTLPILATSSRDGTVCLWDTGTYRYSISSHLLMLDSHSPSKSPAPVTAAPRPPCVMPRTSPCRHSSLLPVRGARKGDVRDGRRLEEAIAMVRECDMSRLMGHSGERHGGIRVVWMHTREFARRKNGGPA
uniref:Uncharacterized protein n=1 Tax=Setaria viridis TaxID=4556 RepID=A0A4U6TGQ2_SETVI|nr:hypothetical protein SEVIR_8G082100v2 [Setaria viridis]